MYSFFSFFYLVVDWPIDDFRCNFSCQIYFHLPEWPKWSQLGALNYLYIKLKSRRQNRKSNLWLDYTAITLLFFIISLYICNKISCSWYVNVKHKQRNRHAIFQMVQQCYKMCTPMMYEVAFKSDFVGKWKTKNTWTILLHFMTCESS